MTKAYICDNCQHPFPGESTGFDPMEIESPGVSVEIAATVKDGYDYCDTCRPTVIAILVTSWLSQYADKDADVAAGELTINTEGEETGTVGSGLGSDTEKVAKTPKGQRHEKGDWLRTGEALTYLGGMMKRGDLVQMAKNEGVTAICGRANRGSIPSAKGQWEYKIGGKFGLQALKRRLSALTVGGKVEATSSSQS